MTRPNTAADFRMRRLVVTCALHCFFSSFLEQTEGLYNLFINATSNSTPLILQNCLISIFRMSYLYSKKLNLFVLSGQTKEGEKALFVKESVIQRNIDNLTHVRFIANKHGVALI